METPPAYMCTESFALRHEVCERTVKGWIAQGMPSYLTGRVRRIIVADAELWLVNGGGSRPKRQTRARRSPTA
jgi:hypothetical protein